jgi:hypothetical protein
VIKQRRSVGTRDCLVAFGAFIALVGLAGCKPATVSEAEAKGDVAWLSTNSSPEAIAALGRLADKNPKAVNVLGSKAATDLNVYSAAWGATLRGAAWGPGVLRAGLTDPLRAESAASAMTRHDPHLVQFVPDLEAALSRIGSGSQNVAVAGALASVGAPAKAAVERRLADKATRGLMCRGISSTDATDEARKSLLSAPESSRDDAACVDAVVRIATTDDATLTWMATTGEPGLLTAAGKTDIMPCPRMRALWSEAIAQRPASAYLVLAVPLAHTLKRCAKDMDALLAETIAKKPGAQVLVVGGVDPYGTETTELKLTCRALPMAVHGSAPPRTKDRAADTIAHGCRASKP